MLIVFGGLPGTGKTTIARELARQLGAVHLRIDSIEQALRDCGATVGNSMNEAGYRVAYAITGDNLCIGRVVIAVGQSAASDPRGMEGSRKAFWGGRHGSRGQLFGSR